MDLGKIVHTDLSRWVASFVRSEEGSLTVEMAVMLGGVVCLGCAAIASVANGVAPNAGNLSEEVRVVRAITFTSRPPDHFLEADLPPPENGT